MRTYNPASIATASIFVILCPGAFAQSRWNAPRIVTWNCSGCHGIDGNAQLSYVPRLSGLDAAYAERRIAEFRAAADPPVDELFSRIFSRAAVASGASRLEASINMVGLAHAMSVADTKISSAWYAQQKPEHRRSGNAALIQSGQVLFAKGFPSEGLIACQTCHGANAEGTAKIPRIAGQNRNYVRSELAKFNAGDRQHAPEMTMVAQHGNDEQFRALAAYLESR